MKPDKLLIVDLTEQGKSLQARHIVDAAFMKQGFWSSCYLREEGTFS